MSDGRCIIISTDAVHHGPIGVLRLKGLSLGDEMEMNQVKDASGKEIGRDVEISDIRGPLNQ